jgi:uncharacterized protein with GYD domain
MRSRTLSRRPSKESSADPHPLPKTLDLPAVRWNHAATLGTKGAEAPRRFVMPMYVSLVRGTQKGHEAIRDLGKRYDQVQNLVKQNEGKLHSAYALFGRFDYLLICEFPSEKEAARCLAQNALRGTASFETMTAMPLGDFIKIAQEV